MIKVLFQVVRGKVVARVLACIKALGQSRRGLAAAAAVGCALLSGAAQGQAVWQLGEHEVDNPVPHPPVYMATETINCGSGSTTQVGGAAYCNVEVTDGNGGVVRGIRDLSIFFIAARSKSALTASEGWFLRVTLGGAGFRELTAASTRTTFKRNAGRSGAFGGQLTLNSTLVHGGTGHKHVVFRLDTDVGLNEWIVVELGRGRDPDRLALADANPGDVTATMTMHSDQFDAIEGRNAVSTAYFGGTSTIIRKFKGLALQVRPGTPAIADVTTEPQGFLWFVNQTGNRHFGDNRGDPRAATISNVLLGCSIARRNIPAGARIGPLNARNGNALEMEHLIAGSGVNVNFRASGVSVKVEGDLSIGAFDLVEPTATAVRCPDRQGTADAPLKGNIKGTVAKPREGTLSGDYDGVQRLCLEVNTAGARSPNSRPIQAQEFTGTISVTLPYAGTPVQSAEGTIGRIVRNGANVHIAHLTVAEKYNQRLVIANRGPTQANWNLGDFTTEAGVTVSLSDAAMRERDAGRNTIPSMGHVVLRVADLLKFTGGADGRRASATLSLNADIMDVQVATTQVNLEDGSTDTVLYIPERDATMTIPGTGC